MGGPIEKMKSSAKQQLDQALLGLQHSSISRFGKSLKNASADPADLVQKVGRRVLERAQVVRESLVEAFLPKDSKKTTGKKTPKQAKAAAPAVKVQAPKAKAKQGKAKLAKAAAPKLAKPIKPKPGQGKAKPAQAAKSNSAKSRASSPRKKA